MRRSSPHTSRRAPHRSSRSIGIGRPLKEEPVKEDDHGMDLLRYVAAYVDDIGKPPSQPFHFIRVGEPSPWAIPSYQRGRGWGDPPGEYQDSWGDRLPRLPI